MEAAAVMKWEMAGVPGGPRLIKARPEVQRFLPALQRGIPQHLNEHAGRHAGMS
jgi:hypothetical protein